MNKREWLLVIPFFRVPRIKGRNRNPAGANRVERRFRGHVGDPAGANRAKRRFRGHVGDPAGANRVERRFRGHVGVSAGGLYFCIRGEKAKKPTSLRTFFG